MSERERFTIYLIIFLIGEKVWKLTFFIQFFFLGEFLDALQLFVSESQKRRLNNYKFSIIFLDEKIFSFFSPLPLLMSLLVTAATVAAVDGSCCCRYCCSSGDGGSSRQLILLPQLRLRLLWSPLQQQELPGAANSCGCVVAVVVTVATVVVAAVIAAAVAATAGAAKVGDKMGNSEKNMELTEKNQISFKLLVCSLRNWSSLVKLWGASSSSLFFFPSHVSPDVWALVCLLNKGEHRSVIFGFDKKDCH